MKCGEMQVVKPAKKVSDLRGYANVESTTSSKGKRSCRVKLRRIMTKFTNNNTECGSSHVSLEHCTNVLTTLSENTLHLRNRIIPKGKKVVEKPLLDAFPLKSLQENRRIHGCFIRLVRLPLRGEQVGEVGKQSTKSYAEGQSGNGETRKSFPGHSNCTKLNLKLKSTKEKTGGLDIQMKSGVKKTIPNNQLVPEILKSKDSETLANKSNEIGNILNTASRKGSEIQNVGTQKSEMKTCKFFKRDKIPSELYMRTRQKTHFAKRNSVSSRNVDVYDFSKSQTTDTDAQKQQDPAADIIKNLIARGKVKVANTRKDKDRPIIKRRPKAKKVEKILKRDDQVTDNNKIDKNTSYNPNNVRDGTYSRLAHSVLLKETVHNHLLRHRSKEPFAVEHKFVSTPKSVGRHPSPAEINTSLSPIVLSSQQTREISNKQLSWHVGEEDKENRQTNSITRLGSSNSVSKGKIYEKGRRTSAKVLSSFSSNVSNAENVTNVEETTSADNNSTSADIFLLRDVSNSQHDLPHRSPLKSINITEAINVPSWKTIKDANEKVGITVLKSNDKRNVSNDFAIREKCDKRQNSNLYGFEEFLEEEWGKGEQVEMVNAKTHDKSLLNKSLYELRKWRPSEIELYNLYESSKLTRHVPVDVFEDKHEGNEEMLQSKATEPSSNKTVKSRYNLRRNRNRLNDFDAEITFNEQELHRTYLRYHRENPGLFTKNSVTLRDKSNHENSSNKHNNNGSGKKKPKRNAVSHPSPNAIKILEVINLPPWKPIYPNEKITGAIQESNDNEKTKEFDLGKVLSDESVNVGEISKDFSQLEGDYRELQKNNLYGFEEYLEEDEWHNSNVEIVSTKSDDDKSLLNKSRELSKWRPTEFEMQQLYTNLKSTPRVGMFEDYRYQHRARHSPMIGPSSSSKTVFKRKRIYNLRDKRKVSGTESPDTSNLFKDTDLETTFNEQDPHRTYMGRNKQDDLLKTNNEESGNKSSADKVSDENNEDRYQLRTRRSAIKKSSSKTVLRQKRIYNLRGKRKVVGTKSPDISNLFNDIYYGTTFNEQDPNRTYIAHYKQGGLRKGNPEEITRNPNSDDKSSGENGEPKQNRKKRLPKDPTSKPELEEFVRTFNKMCDEVDKYDLVIERSA